VQVDSSISIISVNVKQQPRKVRNRKNYFSLTSDTNIQQLVASLSPGFSGVASTVKTDGEKPPEQEISNRNACGIDVILSPPSESDSSSDDEEIFSSDGENDEDNAHPKSKNDNLQSVSPLSVSPIFDYRTSIDSYDSQVDECTCAPAEYIEFLCRPCLEGENIKFCEPDEVVAIF
jgi:hypothetical protein